MPAELCIGTGGPLIPRSRSEPTSISRCLLLAVLQLLAIFLNPPSHCEGTDRHAWQSSKMPRRTYMNEDFHSSRVAAPAPSACRPSQVPLGCQVWRFAARLSWQHRDWLERCDDPQALCHVPAGRGRRMLAVHATHTTLTYRYAKVRHRSAQCATRPSMAKWRKMGIIIAM